MGSTDPSKGKLSVLAATVVGADPEMTKVLVLEGIAVEDRPSALGYFLLNLMRELTYARVQAGGEPIIPQLKLTAGSLSPAEVEANSNVEVLPLQGQEFNEVYKVVLAVEQDRRDIIGGSGGLL